MIFKVQQYWLNQWQEFWAGLSVCLSKTWGRNDTLHPRFSWAINIWATKCSSGPLKSVFEGRNNHQISRISALQQKGFISMQNKRQERDCIVHLKHSSTEHSVQDRNKSRTQKQTHTQSISYGPWLNLLIYLLHLLQNQQSVTECSLIRDPFLAFLLLFSL